MEKESASISRRKLLAGIGMGGAALLCGSVLGIAGCSDTAEVAADTPQQPIPPGTPVQALEQTQELGGTTMTGEQVDYVKLLNDSNNDGNALYVKRIKDRCLEVVIPIRGTRAAHYSFRKDAHDDFVKLEQVAISTFENGQAVKQFDTLQSWSNKEFAFSVRPAGSTAARQWLPEHNSVGTTFALEQRFWFDGDEITAWTPDTSFRQVQSVKLVQHMKGIHPDEPNDPLAEIVCLQSVTTRGVFVKTTVKWLRDVDIQAGYGMMFPGLGTFADQMVTSFGTAYSTAAPDGTISNLTENDQAVSYAFLRAANGTTEQRDIVSAMTVNNIAKTFRYGQAGRRKNGSIVWLQHRDANTQKLYPHVYDAHTIQAGDTYEAEGVYRVGELPMAARLLLKS